MILSNDYYAHCRREKIPFVRVTPRIKYATIDYDMPPPSIPDRWAREEMDRLLGGNGLTLRRIPLHQAALFAQKIFDILSASYARHPVPGSGE